MKIAFEYYGRPVPQGNKTAYPFQKTGADGKPLFRFDARKNARVPVLGVTMTEGRDAESRARFHAYRDGLALVAKTLYKGKPLDGPLRATYKFFLERPKNPSWEYPAGAPDLEKLIRTVNDALKGILIHDDARIVKYGADTGKEWCDPRDERGPRVEIILETLS